MDLYGEDGLPFTTRFGNGDPIGEDIVQLLNETYEAHTAREPWQAGDLLLVDNIRTAHSRDPYTVLHVSLRDLTPQILLASTSIVDDVEHCLKASTSPHLAEQLTGSRDFLAGTLDDVMAGRVTIPAGLPAVFSPFGLGVLDLAVGKYVYDQVTRSGQLHVIDDFFHELSRYG